MQHLPLLFVQHHLICVSCVLCRWRVDFTEGPFRQRRKLEWHEDFYTSYQIDVRRLCNLSLLTAPAPAPALTSPVQASPQAAAAKVTAVVVTEEPAAASAAATAAAASRDVKAAEPATASALPAATGSNKPSAAAAEGAHPAPPPPLSASALASARASIESHQRLRSGFPISLSDHTVHNPASNATTKAAEDGTEANSPPPPASILGSSRDEFSIHAAPKRRVSGTGPISELPPSPSGATPTAASIAAAVGGAQPPTAAAAAAAAPAPASASAAATAPSASTTSASSTSTTADSGFGRSGSGGSGGSVSSSYHPRRNSKGWKALQHAIRVSTSAAKDEEQQTGAAKPALPPKPKMPPKPPRKPGYSTLTSPIPPVPAAAGSSADAPASTAAAVAAAPATPTPAPAATAQPQPPPAATASAASVPSSPAVPSTASAAASTPPPAASKPDSKAAATATPAPTPKPLKREKTEDDVTSSPATTTTAAASASAAATPGGAGAGAGAALPEADSIADKVLRHLESGEQVLDGGLIPCARIAGLDKHDGVAVLCAHNLYVIDGFGMGEAGELVELDPAQAALGAGGVSNALNFTVTLVPRPKVAPPPPPADGALTTSPASPSSAGTSTPSATASLTPPMAAASASAPPSNSSAAPPALSLPPIPAVGIDPAAATPFTVSALPDTHELVLAVEKLKKGAKLPAQTSAATPFSMTGVDSADSAAAGGSGGSAAPPLHPCFKWPYRTIREVHKRRYQLQSVGIEFFHANGSNFLLVFESEEERDEVHTRILTLNERNGGGGAGAQSDSALAPSPLTYSLQTMQQISDTNKNRLKLWKSSVTQRWQKGELSNFAYLMFLNTLAGRSYNDLTQYPVFPWVLADYESGILDLNDARSYRDLSKPMGALGAERALKFRDRYENWEDPMGVVPKFHYGTHYSSAGIVLYYLLRVEPFTRMALQLQGGKFDWADRLFYSIANSWHSASSQGGLSDVKELIPEFYYMPEFLQNK